MATILLTGKPGQLGNMLFLSAHIQATCWESHHTFINPEFEEYAHYFSFPKSQGFRIIGALKYPLRLTNKLLRKLHLHVPFMSRIEIGWNEQYQLSDLDTITKSIIMLKGWQFRNSEALHKHADRIRHLFEPQALIKKEVDTLISSIRNEQSILIGIHVRRGDYKHFEGGKYFYSDEQYIAMAKAFASGLETEKKIKFIVCSNEPTDNICEHLQAISGPGTEISDLLTLSRCDYIIGPPSTYSGWASFYGKVLLHHMEKPEQGIHISDFKMYEV